MNRTRWEWALPGAAATCITTAAAVEVSNDGYDQYRTVGALTLFIFAAALIGAWLVMIGVDHHKHHDSEEKEHD